MRMNEYATPERSRLAVSPGPTMIHDSSPVKPWQPARVKHETISSKEIPGVAVEA